MALKQTIIWTVLPYGIKQGKAWLSVLVSPRLTGDSSSCFLSDFRDFVNWPKTVQKIQFTAQVEGLSAPIGLTPEFNLDFALWAKVFTSGVYVYRHKFTDLKNHKLRSYPVRATLQYLYNQYLSWAQLGLSSPPRFEELVESQKFRELINVMRIPDQENQRNELEEQLRVQKVLKASTNPAHNFYQVYKFYHRDQPTDPLPRPTVPEFDFHEGVALLADHPSLMRALGLVLDFSMPLPPSPTGAIRVIPNWNSEIEKQDIIPFTHYWHSDKEFQANWHTSGDLRDGFLDLSGVCDVFDGNQKNFDLVQVDSDGSLLKLMNFSYALDGLSRGTYPLGMEQETGLPALRTGGLGLVELDRADHLHEHLCEMSNVNMDYESDPETRQYFYLDELLRGYRVDVEDLATDLPPLSLCWRTGHYLFKDGDHMELKPEEGYLKSASTTSQDEADEELYLHEMLFRWNGWSLCAERPHMTIVPASIPENDPGTGRYENVMRTQSMPMGEIDLTSVLEALPGSLPRLRFGHKYRVRVRAVDVAGNSLPADHPDWHKASNPITYMRYEPVSSPTLVLKDSISAGEGIERMVIRSNFDTPAVSDNQRHVVPPKTSQEMAETHGEFDRYIGPGKDHQQGRNIALKESGTLNDIEVIDINTGLKVLLDEADKISFDTITTDGGDETELVIHGENKLILPYLPDPMSAGTAIHGIPRLDEDWLPDLDKVIFPDYGINVVKVPFELNWPEAHCFRLRLAERTGSMLGKNCDESFIDDDTQKSQWDSEARELSIFLAKAEKVTLRYSSYLRVGSQNLFAVWNWLRKSKNNYEMYKIYLEAGSLWMITPHRKLELVHAVQQPLCEPTLGASVSAQKTAMGQTWVNIIGNATLNAWSTEKVDLMAEWEEWDDTDREGPKRIRGLKAYACEGLIPYTEDNKRNLNADPHNLSHELGDTRHRWVDYHLVATSRYREYFEPVSESTDFTRIGPAKQLNIENSARPVSPKVVYVIPSFGWKRTKQGNSLTSIRLGGGLRVYMDRPWFSSGDDELLGVVLPNAPGNTPQPIPEDMQPYVTQCGLDPIWETSNPEKTTNLTYSDFKGYKACGERISLEEPTDETMDQSTESDLTKYVDVVGYEPEYNAERKMWFCDVQFNPDRLSTYYPFVRLGLARYQPYSIPNAFLSPVVMTDFIQLVPTRVLQISKTVSQKNRITFGVTLSGFAPKFSRENHPPTLFTNEVTVTIEMHDRNIPGELGWNPLSESKFDMLPLELKNEEALKNSTYLLTPSPSPDNPNLFTWHRTLQLPVSLLQSNETFRLVVKEYEYYWADGERDISSNELTRKTDRRVVYTDIVALNDL